MQVLQAGQHKLILLELEPELVANIAKQAGFDTKLKDTQRSITLDLTAAGRQAPLLLFDAADPPNPRRVFPPPVPQISAVFRAASFTSTAAAAVSCRRPSASPTSATAAASRSPIPCG